MGSIVHRSVPTNLKWLPNCSHAHALFQDRFKDVQEVQGGSVHCTSSHQTFTHRNLPCSATTGGTRRSPSVILARR